MTGFPMTLTWVVDKGNCRLLGDQHPAGGHEPIGDQAKHDAGAGAGDMQDGEDRARLGRRKTRFPPKEHHEICS